MQDRLPPQFRLAHELCFLYRDVLVEVLDAAEAWRTFELRTQIDDEERAKLEASAHVFDWLDATGRDDDRRRILQTITFQAVLSDYLLFIYTALDCSRHERLCVAYALLRKPMQDNLFVLECIAAGPEEFADTLHRNPQLLHGPKAGGVTVHAARIARVLESIGEADSFDAAYIAQLRYAKSENDSFENGWQHAMHLFTSHSALKTEPMNINFVFAGPEENLTLWSFLYSRLPYLLAYSWRLVEHVLTRYSKTDPVYAAELDRRCAAGVLLWARTMPPNYEAAELEHFARAQEHRLAALCDARGVEFPRSERDLARMFRLGAWTGESAIRVGIRDLRYRGLRAAAPLWHRINDWRDNQR